MPKNPETPNLDLILAFRELRKASDRVFTLMERYLSDGASVKVHAMPLEVPQKRQPPSFEPPPCPKCGAQMHWRWSPRNETYFAGCSTFLSAGCRGTVSAERAELERSGAKGLPKANGLPNPREVVHDHDDYRDDDPYEPPPF